MIDFLIITIKIEIARLTSIYFRIFTPNVRVMVGLVWIQFCLEPMGLEAQQKCEHCSFFPSKHFSDYHLIDLKMECVPCTMASVIHNQSLL